MTLASNIITNFICNTTNTIPNTLNYKINMNNKKLQQRTVISDVKNRIDTFLNGNRLNRFIVLPGLRGVGKTTILYQIYEYLLKDKNVSPNQILYFSCEDLNNISQCNIRQAVEIFLDTQHHKKLRTIDKNIFLLIDESQYDSSWAISGKIIYDKTDNIFMIFTGSSAINLEYNADAARRMIKIPIAPLNYAEHLKLKFNIDFSDVSQSLIDLIFNGNVNNAVKDEEYINNALTNNIEYNPSDWNQYFKFGGFPSLFHETTAYDIENRLVDITKKVVNTDMLTIKNITFENQSVTNRIIRFLALQAPEDLSHSRLSKILNTSSANVKNILDILEKTHLIFHCDPYGTSSKRVKKTWKYYFATSSMRNALASSIGKTSIHTSEYEGMLLENLIASSLNNLSNRENNAFSIYYDSDKKSSVDFLVQKDFKSPIPIEVGRGKKDKRQVINAMNKYGSEYGIIVSNKTRLIEKEDDIIYISPRTFSFL